MIKDQKTFLLYVRIIVIARPYVYFFHLPKTGGMSVAGFFGSLAQKKIIDIGHRGHLKITSKLSLGNQKFIPDPYKRRVWTFSILRDPVQHTKSLYNYIRNNPNHQHHKFALKKTFSQWIRDCKALENYYAKFYTHGNQKLEQMKFSLKCLDFIAFTESLNSDTNKFLDKIGVSMKFDNRHINKSKSNNIIITGSDINYIKNIKRPKDYILMDMARKKWRNQ